MPFRNYFPHSNECRNTMVIWCTPKKVFKLYLIAWRNKLTFKVCYNMMTFVCKFCLSYPWTITVKASSTKEFKIHSRIWRILFKLNILNGLHEILPHLKFYISFTIVTCALLALLYLRTTSFIIVNDWIGHNSHKGLILLCIMNIHISIFHMMSIFVLLRVIEIRRIRIVQIIVRLLYMYHSYDQRSHKSCV